MLYQKNNNPLLRYFESNSQRRIDKWMHYFDIYHEHFNTFRKKDITVVEFGIQNGGSLQMWRKYFGKRAKLYGVDIDPRCKVVEKDGVTVFIGDQADRKFLKKIAKSIGDIDILIDDGGHTMEQQIATFEELYPYVKIGGVYLVEDTHSSYWKRFGGGHKKNTSFIEYTKSLVDNLNAWHSETKNLTVDEFTKTTKSISFYDSVVVFRKYDASTHPQRRQTGKFSF